MAVASTAIAATPSHLRPICVPSVVLAAALVLGACTDRDGEGDATRSTTSTTTTTTSAPALRCPDGATVPDAPPVATAPPLAATPQGPDGRDGALDIATLLPRTGDLAFLGPGALAGVELAVADLEAAGGVLGAPVGLRHGDSAEGTPGTAATEVGALLEGGADVVVGPLASSTASQVLDQVAGADALLVSPASTSSGLEALDRSGRLFRTAPTEALQGRALADLVLSDGHRTVSVAARADDYGRSIADALAARLEEAGASVTSRIDYDPNAEDLGGDVVDGLGALDTSADAIVLAGLAEAALILDALVAVGEGPRVRPVYGTDGNLGERLGDLVADREELACMRGLLPVAAPDEDFAERVRAHDPALGDLDRAGLDLAAEAYDATAVAALAAAAAGSDDAGAMAAAMARVTRGATPCDGPEDCLPLLADGATVAYVGPSGPIAFDPAGDRTDAGFTVVAFDADGHLARLGSRRARS